MTCQFRSTHTAPILICILSADSTILFTGSADFTVKLWNISERSCLQTLKGPSVVSAIRLVDASTLIVGYVEGQLRIFDLSNRRLNPKDLNIHSRLVFNTYLLC
jgi:WD40 repeat protein